MWGDGGPPPSASAPWPGQNGIGLATIFGWFDETCPVEENGSSGGFVFFPQASDGSGAVRGSSTAGGHPFWPGALGLDPRQAAILSFRQVLHATDILGRQGEGRVHP